MTDAHGDRECESLNGWWHTWLDEAADWEHEDLPPPDTPADALPRRTPTAGWDGMEWGMESTRVPGSLAQARPGYRGVAWQWRPIVIPEAWRGRLVYLVLGGARQRTEVYLDERPVGYDLDGLTPMITDLTPYVRPGGQYELALRVTNPGGWRMDEERGAIRWGSAALPGSRDVGGLWGGAALVALPRLHVVDLVVIPGDTLGEATARVVLRNVGVTTAAEVRLAIAAGGRLAGTTPSARGVAVPSGRDAVVTLPFAIAEPVEWAPQHPHLYRIAAEVRSEHGVDRREAPLGLRRVHERDGHRIVGRDAAPLSTGLAPGSTGHDVPLSPAAAERAVARARAAGVGSLMATGWPAEPALLRSSDRLGMPVVQTLVGVDDAERVSGGARELYRTLVRDRLRRLIQRNRNHPSVVAWRLAMARDEAAFGALVALVRTYDATRPVLSIDQPTIVSAR
jgi:beta-galactosidase